MPAPSLGTGIASCRIKVEIAPMYRFSAMSLLVLFLLGCREKHESGPPPVTLSSIAISPVAPSAQLLTATLQFTATGTFSDGSTQVLTGALSWTSSSTAVATISGTGLATSVGAGTTTISASSSGITGSTVLTVTPAALAWDQAGWDTVHWQ